MESGKDDVVRKTAKAVSESGDLPRTSTSLHPASFPVGFSFPLRFAHTTIFTLIFSSFTMSQNPREQWERLQVLLQNRGGPHLKRFGGGGGGRGFGAAGALLVGVGAIFLASDCLFNGEKAFNSTG